MKRLFYMFVCICALIGCQREVLYQNPLSLSAQRNDLAAKGGSTAVLVFANEPWIAYLPTNCNWASIEKGEGEGLGEFVFHFDENDGVSRKVNVTVTTGKHTVYIEMAQKSGVGDAVITFPYSSISVASVSGHATVPFTSNIPESETSKIIGSVTGLKGESADWVQDLTVYSDRVTFNLQKNESSEKRNAVLSLTYVDAFGTEVIRNLSLIQTAESATLNFDPSITGVMFTSMGTTVKLPFSTNLSLFVPQLVQNAKSTRDWAQIVMSEDTKPEIVVNIDENKSGARTCRITTEYVDSDGNTVPFEYILVQKGYVEQVTFAQIKDAISAPAGELVYAQDALLEAVVISDCANANVETNPNTAVNNIDFTRNWRTVYLASHDGTSGIRAVFDAQTDNILHRGDVIYLDMQGLKLTKEANPARYTLSGLKSSSYSIADNKAEVVVREKTVAELTDDDVYTAVKLKGLEFTFKHGAYTNCHDGYQRQLRTPNYPNVLGGHINSAGSGVGYYFSDCTPCALMDREGHCIYALFNNETPWRRYGNGVPQGECDIECVITHTDLIRWAYKGNLGRYQIRIFEEKDIAQVGQAFSKVAIEWNWGENAGLLPRSEAVVPTTIAPGAFSSITSNMDKTASFNRTTTDNMCDFNNVINNNPDDTKNHKGYVKDGSVHWYKSGLFWASDSADDMEGAPWFCFGFSTKGMSGSNVMFNWTAVQGAGWGGGTDRYAPTVWKVEYSVDGVNFTAVDATYAIHPLVQYNTNCAAFAINGLHQYSTPLPASLLGNEKVYVRIKAAGNNAIKSDGSDAYSGKIASGSNMIRFGEIAVLYN